MDSHFEVNFILHLEGECFLTSTWTQGCFHRVTFKQFTCLDLNVYLLAPFDVNFEFQFKFTTEFGLKLKIDAPFPLAMQMGCMTREASHSQR